MESHARASVCGAVGDSYPECPALPAVTAASTHAAARAVVFWSDLIDVPSAAGVLCLARRAGRVAAKPLLAASTSRSMRLDDDVCLAPWQQCMKLWPIIVLETMRIFLTNQGVGNHAEYCDQPECWKPCRRAGGNRPARPCGTRGSCGECERADTSNALARRTERATSGMLRPRNGGNHGSRAANWAQGAGCCCRCVRLLPPRKAWNDARAFVIA